MEQLASKPSTTIYLSGHEPISSSYTLNYVCILQGMTNIVLNLSNIDTSIYNIYKLVFLKNTDIIDTIYPIVSGGNTILPSNTINYNYTPTTIDVLTLSAFYRNGKNITFNISLCATFDNILDMDLTILNSQMTYVSGSYVPIINFESNSNTIYPISYFETGSASQQFISIYLKTDPELTPSLSTTTFRILSSSNYINTEDSERIIAI